MSQTGFGRAATAGIVSGLAATFLGVGLARFAYTALLPELILQSWFSETEAAYLGAANLLGYALGALMAVHLARSVGAFRFVLFCGLTVVLSFIACAWPIPFVPYLIARSVSGFCGAALMVLVPSAALAAVPPNHRAVGASLVFTGVGLGILISATAVPLLAVESLSFAWLVLAISGGFALFLIKRHFLSVPVPKPKTNQAVDQPSPPNKWLIISVATAYAMDAVGFVPHTLFWVDYLQRHLGLAVGVSAIQWGLFGIGAISGPFLIARLGRRLTWHNLLVGALAVKGIAVLLPLVGPHVLSLTLSSVIVGALVPGMVAIVSGRMTELASPSGHARLWGLATATFACAQGASAALFAWLYDDVQDGAHLIFMIGGAALLGGALLAEIVYRSKSAQPMDIPESVLVTQDTKQTYKHSQRNGGYR